MKKSTLLVIACGLMTMTASAATAPFYTIPDGAFYRGWACGSFGNAPVGNIEVLCPANVPLTFTASTDNPPARWTYQSYDPSTGQWSEQNATGSNLVMPGLPFAYDGTAMPTVTIDGQSYTGNARLHTIGNSMVTAADNTTWLGYYQSDLSLACNNATKSDDLLQYMFYPDFNIGSMVPGTNTAITKVGFSVAKPAGPYKITGITWQGLISSSFNGDGIKAEIYKTGENNSLGELIAAGSIAKENVEADDKYHSFAIMLDNLTDGYMEINDAITVLFSGWKVNEAIPMQLIGSHNNPDSAPLAKASSAIYEVDGTINRWADSMTDGKFNNSFIANYGMGLLLFNNVVTLPADAKTLECAIALTGGSAKVELHPNIDLANATLTGDGLGDNGWFNVEFGEWNGATHTQTATITATATDTARESSFTISIPGASASVKVSQSKSSGISGINAEANETVHSRYIDLTGRILSGEPDNGMFIRIDTKSDGSTVTTKVVKQ